MTTARQGPGSQDTRTRDALLRAAARIMVEEGYAAATTRRVAARAGVKPSLVHYYFPTMDDLFLDLFRRGADDRLARQEQALAGDDPLRALWDLSRDPDGTSLNAEFAAMANHRKAIRAEIAARTERAREVQTKALARLLRERGLGPDDLAPSAAAFLVQAVSTLLVMEGQLGLTSGHAETAALIDGFLGRAPGPDVPSAD